MFGFAKLYFLNLLFGFLGMTQTLPFPQDNPYFLLILDIQLHFLPCSLDICMFSNSHLTVIFLVLFEGIGECMTQCRIVKMEDPEHRGVAAYNTFWIINNTRLLMLPNNHIIFSLSGHSPTLLHENFISLLSPHRSNLILILVLRSLPFFCFPFH